MTTTTAPPFPIDRLLTCGHCSTEITLSGEPETRYRCPNSCLPALKAVELNRLVIGAVTSAVITDSTIPTLMNAVANTMDETREQNPSITVPDPSPQQIRDLATDPETLLNPDEVTAAAKLLHTLIHRIELDRDRASIQYAMAMPPGSPLAGESRQEIEVPESVTV